VDYHSAFAERSNRVANDRLSKQPIRFAAITADRVSTQSNFKLVSASSVFSVVKRMSSVVFLRAVNVGGTNRCQPALIATQLAKFGVVNIGAVGTFVVREDVSE